MGTKIVIVGTIIAYKYSFEKFDLQLDNFSIVSKNKFFIIFSWGIINNINLILNLILTFHNY